METRFEVKFKETVEAFCLGFEDIHLVNDGGYERGYAEGHDIGFAEGETVGYDKGYDKGVEDTTPSGEIELTENNTTYDVLRVATAKVKVPNKLASLANKSIAEITAADLVGVNTIGKYGLAYCYALEKVSIPDNVHLISEYAFYENRNLKSIRIPKNARLSFSAFYESSSVEDIYVDDLEQWLSYEWSGERNTLVFGGNATLHLGDNEVSDVIIPHPNIPAYAFFKLYSLKSVEFTDAVESIGNYAFSHTHIENVRVPNSVVSLGTNAFAYCNSLKEAWIGKGLQTLPSNLFSYCYQLQVVHLSDGITSIGSSAFSYCKNLKFVAIPHTVTTINSSAFSSCDNLHLDLTDYGADYPFPALSSSSAIPSKTTVKISVITGRKAELEAMTNWSSHSSRIVEVDVRPDIPAITNELVYQSGAKQGTCTDEELIIPSEINGVSVTQIAASGFQDCASKKIVIPDSVTYIEREAFLSCGAEYVELPQNLGSIPYKCFMSANLKEINIPDSVTSIDDEAFAAYKLRKITIGRGLKTTYASSFTCNPFLYEISVHEENAKYTVDNNLLVSNGGAALVYCGGLPQTTFDMNTLSATVTTLNNYAFYKSRYLEHIIISPQVTSIGSETFGQCYNLKSVVIPASVKSIGKWAFNSTYSLEFVDLTAYGSDDPFPSLSSSNAFSGSNDYEIRVPKGRKAELASMTNWSYLAAKIVEV